MKKLLLTCFLACAFFSCSKDEHCTGHDDDPFIFGIAYGECGGDCARFYKLEDGRVYADNIQNFYTQQVTFQGTPLHDSIYQLVKFVREDLPSYLQNNAAGTLGCPDCYDQGILYLEFTSNGTRKKWRLDTAIDDLPPQIQAYAEEVLEVLYHL